MNYARLKDIRSLYEHRPNSSKLASLITSEHLDIEEAKLRSFAYDSLKRLPLLLLLLPHCLKFYLLFFYYAKFRLGLSRFLKIRFYVNLHVLLSTTRKSVSFRKFSANPSTTAASETGSVSLRPRFRPICCCCFLRNCDSQRF